MIKGWPGLPMAYIPPCQSSRAWDTLELHQRALNILVLHVVKAHLLSRLKFQNEVGKIYGGPRHLTELCATPQGRGVSTCEQWGVIPLPPPRWLEFKAETLRDNLVGLWFNERQKGAAGLEPGESSAMLT